MPIALDAAVDHLLQSRDGHRAVTPLTEKYPDLSMGEAYGVQRALEQDRHHDLEHEDHGKRQGDERA